jgi:hypothetical protein
LKIRVRLIAAALLALAAARAEAIPAFAKKYGMSCSACHLAWPILNAEGQNFRDNGYLFGLGKDDPVHLSQDYLPIALRTTPAYQYTRVTHQPSADGPVTVQTGGVPLPPGVDLLTAGNISPEVSWLLVLSGFSPSDGQVAAESAWVRLNRLSGTTWLNAKIGKFELDQPISPHRGIALLAGYPATGAHPFGSLVPLDLAENQVGVEFDGHDARSLTRYSVSLTSINGGEGLSGNGWSSPFVWAHLQQAFELDNRVVPWVRLGAFGGVGWWPTTFALDDTGAPIPGTGRDHKTLQRAGAELSWLMGEEATPLTVTAAWHYGRESAGLAQGTDPVSGEDVSLRSATFQGGYLELVWVPFAEPRYDATPWAFFARYDLTRYKNAVGDVDGATLGARHYLVLGPRASAAVHLELHYDRARRTSPIASAAGPPLDVETQAAMAGIDFDF